MSIAKIMLYEACVLFMKFMLTIDLAKSYGGLVCIHYVLIGLYKYCVS